LAQAFDVCVFGAGPAGLSVTARLLDRGRKVAVLDRPAKIRPWGGESFSGAIRGPLVALGVWDAFATAGHVRGYERQVAWGGEPQCESSLIQPSGHMWHVDRARFDSDLSEAVRRRGGIFFSYRKLLAVARRSESWRLILDGGAELSARYLVDATGRARTLAKRFGARITFYDRLIGLTAKVSDNKSPFRVASLMIQSTPFGWWYAAPVPHGHVVALFTDADLGSLQVRQHLRPVAANSAFTHIVQDDNWVAVGDACASHDPLCGWGVHRALSNGIRAADAIDEYLREGNPGPLTDYRQHCRKQFDEYLEGLKRHYALERRWADALFWARRTDDLRARGED
jgi:flavin-dependent dehydrogenase